MIILFLSNNIYAKYNLILETNKISLSRDTSLPRYEISYSQKDWTNQDVIITLRTDKEVENIDGFDTIETGKLFSKVISQNESKEIILKDYSGNNTEVIYSVNNIDKEKPQIIGITDGAYTSTEVKLEYKDNVGIKEIFVDRYSSLDFRVFDDFYDTDFYFGIDTIDTKITPRILSHPKGTRKYKYYLNNVLQAITENTEYTFSGVIPGNKYIVKIEAIDENGTVLETVEKETFTNFFSNIETRKSDDIYNAKLMNIDSRIKSFSYVIWSDEDKEDSMTWYTGGNISTDRTLELEFNRQNFGSYTDKSYIYRIHIFLYDETGNIISTLPINILFGKTVPKKSEIDIYNLTEGGIYQIIATDFAGNKTEYNIYIIK